MVVSSQGKRIREQRYVFLLACLVSLIGLIFYIFGRYSIPFPSQWLSNVREQEKGYRLLFLGIGVQLQVNFFLGFFFQFFLSEKTDQVKFKKWRYWISKGLVFIFSLGLGLFKFKEIWQKNSWGDILLLSLIITVINCCLLELLVQLMNQYGICNAFNLMLLIEFLPRELFEGNWEPFSFLGLSFITIFFIWITNLKWEVPVDTNSLYSQDNKLLKKKSKLGFKLSFSFMPLIYLSQFISFIYSLYLIKGEVNWFNLGEVIGKWGEVELEKKQSVDRLGEGKGLWSSLFILNEEKRIFASENIWNWISAIKWKIFAALFLLLLFRWLVVWSQMRFVQWNPNEISKDLRKKGIYIDGVRPGRSTSNLLKVIINKMVFLWYFIVLFFNIIFDNLFSGLTTFSNWFGGVNIGVDLIKQIRTKYRYIYAN